MMDMDQIRLMFSSKNSTGWDPTFLSQPVAVLEGDLSMDPDNIVDFFKTHNGRIITGFLSYEYGVAQLGVEPTTRKLMDIPDVYFVAFDGSSDEEQYSLQKPTYHSPLLSSIVSENLYKRDIDTIIDHIKNGDVYQVNYTQPLTGEFQGVPFDLFQLYLSQNQVEFSAFFQHPEFSILSLSPERFLKVRGRTLLTEPIKGTHPRGQNEDEDNQNRDALLASEKEEAELNMITDLLRNDLGKISETGTVHVEKHRDILGLEKVWHTRSLVSGILKESLSPIEAILSMIPGGSISGCPKKRAVEIIDSLEIYRRGIYTGTIGIQYPNGDSDWSIAIRTAVVSKGEIYLGVGGGITLDSDSCGEYLESLAKAKSFTEIPP